MKRMLVFFLLLILLSSHFQTISAAFYDEEPPTDEVIQRILEIFEVRVNVWNSLLEPTRETETKNIKLMLKEHMSGYLLEEEIKLYKEMIDDPTSFERILGFEIKESRQLEGDHNRVKVFVQIQWELEDYDGIITESINYILELRKNRDTWSMTDYEVVFYR